MCFHDASYGYTRNGISKKSKLCSLTAVCQSSHSDSFRFRFGTNRVFKTTQKCDSALYGWCHIGFRTLSPSSANFRFGSHHVGRHTRNPIFMCCSPSTRTDTFYSGNLLPSLFTPYHSKAHASLPNPNAARRKVRRQPSYAPRLLFACPFFVCPFRRRLFKSPTELANSVGLCVK